DVLNPLVVQKMQRETDPAVRVAYVRLIDETGSADSAAVVLGAALSDGDARVRAAALEGLARRGGDRMEAAVHDESPAIRRRALALLGRPPDALDRISEALQDDDPSVRKVAAIALTARAGNEAVALLRVSARSHDAVVRELARDALARRNVPPEPPKL